MGAWAGGAKTEGNSVKRVRKWGGVVVRAAMSGEGSVAEPVLF